MATFTDKFSSGGATLKLIVTRESYSIENNTSYLKCVLKITKDKAYNSYNLSSASISMTINSKELYSSNKFDIRGLSVGDTKTLATKYITVSHNTDGTKSVTCKASFNSGVSLGSASISDSYTCGTIPRASSVTLSGTSVNVGSSIKANISRHSTNFTHTVEFYINSSYSEKYTNVKTSQEFTIPTSWYNYMSSSTSCKAYCRVTTFNSSGTQIGDKVTQSFTVKVPSSIVPIVGNIKFVPNDISPGGQILVQGKNKFTLSISGCTAGTGSSIQSYTFSGPGLESTTQSNTSISGGPVSSSGSLTYTVTVTDTRGRTASTTKTVTCYKYANPYFSDFNAYRANVDGKANPNGSYIQCEYTPVYSSTSVLKNDVTVKATAVGSSSTRTENGSNGKALISLDGDTNITYKVFLTITDKYGGTKTSSTKTVAGAFRVTNISPDGTGVAFGKMSEINECIESRYKILGRSGFYLMNNSSYYPAVTSATDDLWIGATGKEGVHNTKGGTYISAGAHNNIYASKLTDGVRVNYAILDAKNYTDYVLDKDSVLEKPVLLANTSSSGDVTLSESADNFSYIEIFYRENTVVGDTGSKVHSSVKIYNPHGKVADLTSIYTDVNESKVYIKTSYYLISGTKITKKQSSHITLKDDSVKVYKQGDSTNITPNTEIEIYRVLGYK